MKIGQIFKKSFQALKGNWVAMFFGSLLCNLGFFLTNIIAGPLYLGISSMSLRVVRGEKVRATDMYSGFGRFLESFLLYWCNSFLVFLWSLLFYIPGIYKSFKYSMSYFILAENPRMSQEEARRESMDLTEGAVGKLLLLDLIYILMVVIGFFSFGILLIWIMPFVHVCQAVVYEELKKEHAPIYRTRENETSEAVSAESNG